MRRFLLAAALFFAFPAAAQQISRAPQPISGDPWQSPSFTATAASGSSAFIMSAGARLCGDGSTCSLRLANVSGTWTFTGGNLAAPNLSGTNSGDVTLAAIGSSPNANGASLSGQVLTLQPASGSFGGILTTGAQTIAGAKTFSGAISASNLSGTNSGDVTLAAFGSSPDAKGATLSGQALTLQPADLTHPGLLTSGAQSIGGLKNFADGLAAADVTVNGAVLSWLFGQVISPQTNLLPSSTSFASFNTSYHGGSPDPGAITITNGTTDVTDPAGGNLAAKLVIPAVSGSGTAVIGHGQSLSGTKEARVVLRTLTGTATIYLMTTSDGVTFHSTPCSVTSSWAVCTLTVADNENYWQLGVDLRDGTQSAQSAQTVYAYGMWYAPKS